MNPPTSVAAAEKVSPAKPSQPPEAKPSTASDSKERATTPRAKNQVEIDAESERMRTAGGRITAHSLQELEVLAAELEEVRDFLKFESERVQREISNHAQLNKNALAAIKNITQTIGPWKNAALDGDEQAASEPMAAEIETALRAAVGGK